MKLYRRKIKRSIQLMCLLTLLATGYMAVGYSSDPLVAHADTKTSQIPKPEFLFNKISPASGDGAEPVRRQRTPREKIAAANQPVDDQYQVQAVLVAAHNAVISSTIDGRVLNFPYKNGDVFEKGDVLVEYDCSIDRARLKEAQSRLRLSQSQLDAYEKLRKMKVIAKVELDTAYENAVQSRAVVDQVRSRLDMCSIKAPFSGRVTNKMASQYEFVQTGRVMLEVVSNDPLQAEFLIPSRWLRWLNVGIPLQIYIEETNKKYDARIISVHGEVDPVSQSVQVVGEISSYDETLLPGMSGRAIFSSQTVNHRPNFGFLGMMLEGNDDGATPNTRE